MKEPLKWNENLIYLTVAYLFVNAAFAFHASTLNGGGSLGYVFIFPIFWVVYIIGVGFFAYNQRKILFEKNTKKSSLFLLFFCTPIPYLILLQVYGLIVMLF